MVYLLVEQLSKHRVRLPNGKLTPAFILPDEAFTYADKHNIQHCRIIPTNNEENKKITHTHNKHRTLENFI